MRPETSMRRAWLTAVLGALLSAGSACGQDQGGEARTETRPSAESKPESRPGASAASTLEETRLIMGKWIETQQIISKERKEWHQGKDILVGRLDVVKQEMSSLDDKIKKAESSVAEADKKKAALEAERDQLKATSTQLATAVGAMEGEVRRLFKTLPEPIQTRIKPLYQRIPEDPATTRIGLGERYQNVLGILNLVNTANNEITVSYEVHEMADGKPSEVKAIYVGLAQAYYVSARGEAGIGRPTPDGWKWEPSKAIAPDVLRALEVREAKHSPIFVPLPVKLQ